MSDSKLATDWDLYYRSVPPTAKLTRRYSTAVLIEAMKRYAAPAGAAGGLALVEIGGANSCFIDAILAAIPCRSYDVIDTNRYGLSLLAEKSGGAGVIRLHQASVLDCPLDISADLVFSVGLIEHFDPEQTRTAIRTHFNLLRPGGTAILTFPTPTGLYRVTRGLIEAAGMWKFPDERPLEPPEVLATIRELADVVWRKTLWPLMLTQHLVVAKKRPASLR